MFLESASLAIDRCQVGAGRLPPRLRRGRHEALAVRSLLTVFRDVFTHSGKSLSVDDNYRCSKGLRSILARTKTRPTSAPTAAQLTLFHASGCAAPIATHSAFSVLGKAARLTSSRWPAAPPRSLSRSATSALACCADGFWGPSARRAFLGCIPTPIWGFIRPLSGGRVATSQK
jgi:hypothetical protein